MYSENLLPQSVGAIQNHMQAQMHIICVTNTLKLK